MSGQALDGDRRQKAARAVTDATDALIAAERTDEAMDLLIGFVLATDGRKASPLPLDSEAVDGALLSAERFYREHDELTKQRADALARLRTTLGSFKPAGK